MYTANYGKILLEFYRKGSIMEFEKYRFSGDKKFDIHTFDTSDTGSFESKKEAKAEIKKDKHLMESLPREALCAR